LKLGLALALKGVLDHCQNFSSASAGLSTKKISSHIQLLVYVFARLSVGVIRLNKESLCKLNINRGQPVLRIALIDQHCDVFMWDGSMIIPNFLFVFD
jgi:hypothetical protein